MQPTIEPATQRSNGSWRKEVKIRPGYINPEAVPKYKAPGTKPSSTPVRVFEYKTKQKEETKLEVEEPKKKRIRKKKEDYYDEDQESNIIEQNNNSNNTTNKIDTKENSTQLNDETEKQLRKLKKKLRQIEELEIKKKEGKELNLDEQKKLSSKDEILQQIQEANKQIEGQ